MPRDVSFPNNLRFLSFILHPRLCSPASEMETEVLWNSERRNKKALNDPMNRHGPHWAQFKTEAHLEKHLPGQNGGCH